MLVQGAGRLILFPLILRCFYGAEWVLADVRDSNLRWLRRDLGHHARGTRCGSLDWACWSCPRKHHDGLPQQSFGLDKRFLVVLAQSRLY